MGERVTFEIGNNGLVVYAHWEGDRWREIVANAMANFYYMWPDTYMNPIGAAVLVTAQGHAFDEEDHATFDIVRDDMALSKWMDPTYGDPSIVVNMKTKDVEVRQSNTVDENNLPFVYLITEDCILEIHPTVGTKEALRRIQSALAKEVRWDDHEYLARIIYDSLSGLPFEECSFGIGSEKSLHEQRHIKITESGVSWSDYDGQGECSLEEVSKWKTGLF